ncbi:MAG TPA: UDP-N-acetylmuramyl pentapeptide phosphotransferase [Clostridia bacterium]|nr:UDP-N-acetylmuramyl pentapeptide phosphotransferase [Clostridia bacterium]
MRPLALLLLGYGLTRCCLPWSLKYMLAKGFKATNYLGHTLPAPAGVVPAAVSLTVMAATRPWLRPVEGWSVLLLCLSIAVLGLVDDLKGEGIHKGFRGHFRALRHGHVTTGFIKAAGGLILALTGAWTLGNHELINLVVNTLLIALMTNFLNLMDLRPGRATKSFIAGAAILVLAAPRAEPDWLFIVVGSALAYLPDDLKMKSMLGDTGANFWGFVLGLSAVVSLSITVKAMVLALLLAVHFYAERHSITRLIERTPWLNYLDRLGRPDY